VFWRKWPEMAVNNIPWKCTKMTVNLHKLLLNISETMSSVRKNVVSKQVSEVIKY
jgi:hypothetical protein